MYLYSALLVGLLGSFHCIGMCGPIAMALPVRQATIKRQLLGRILYNTGRIVTYSLLGLVIGLIGHVFVIKGFEKSLSIASGIIILTIVFFSRTSNKIVAFNYFLNRFTAQIKNIFKRLFKNHSAVSLFLIGTVNGLLPCGFVYLALAGASATGNARNGFLYMMMFGAGTLPMMLALSMTGQFLGIRFLPAFRKASPWIAAALAVFLIYRGISFRPDTCCHHH